jgi:colicin import membrane protein
MALPDQRLAVFENNVGALEVGAGVSSPEDEFAAQLAKDEAEALAKIKADDDAFKAEQDALDLAVKTQLDLQSKADADAFKKSQADIQLMVDTQMATLQKQKDEYAAQQAAAQESAAQAAREAEAAQAEIAKQLAETQRLTAESAAKTKAEMEAMQRTSAAKIAGSRKAGRSAADRSLLSAYGPAQSGPPTLGGSGGLGGFGAGLGTTQTLGVGG